MPLITGLNPLQAVERVQKAVDTHKVAAWVDTTKTFDLAGAREKFNVSRMLLSQPTDDIQTRDVLEALIRSGQVDIIVLDNRDEDCEISVHHLRALEQLSNEIPVVKGTFCNVILLERWCA